MVIQENFKNTLFTQNFVFCLSELFTLIIDLTLLFVFLLFYFYSIFTFCKCIYFCSIFSLFATVASNSDNINYIKKNMCLSKTLNTWCFVEIGFHPNYLPNSFVFFYWLLNFLFVGCFLTENYMTIQAKTN